MLCYDRIDLSEGIDLIKSNNSKECIICHFWFFKSWVQMSRFQL